MQHWLCVGGHGAFNEREEIVLLNSILGLKIGIYKMHIKLSAFCLLSCAAFAGEITVSELIPSARNDTEPYFKDNAEAVSMTITEQTYKVTPEGDLFTRIYAPASLEPGKQYPCAVFFCGGGWVNGSLLQFGKHCEYLVSKGFIAMTPQYRMEEVNGTTPREAAEDAISCIRWVREHAGELNIDPDRILAGGGSAGGHLAAATATLTEIYSTNDNLTVSCRPDLLALFNPVVNAGPGTPHYDLVTDYWEEFSPAHNLQETMPDSVIFHGLEDSQVPVWTAQDFSAALESTGAVSVLYLYPGRDHGFFNEGDGENPYFYDSLDRMGQFLEEEGWIQFSAPEAGTVYNEEFYIDGTIRTENQGLDGTVVGSESDGTGIGLGAYTWTVTQTNGFYSKYNRPGAEVVGDGGLYYNQLAGAYSYATVDFDDFTDFGTLTLTAEANALDCSPLRMGFGVDAENSFDLESGDAVYIESLGGGVLNSEVDVSLVMRHDGTTTILETFTGIDRLTAANDTLTLKYDVENNSVSAVFYDGGNALSYTFGSYTLNFVPNLSCVKYEIQNEGSFGNSNFPRWEKTSLSATLPETAAEVPAANSPVYCGFYRGSEMDNGLYTFTDLTDPLGSATRVGSWPFPDPTYSGVGFNGTSYFIFNRGSNFGGPGLNHYDGATSFPNISDTYTFEDWQGIGFCNDVYYGLYSGVSQSGPGLYIFTDPADPFSTGIRLFQTQEFSSNVWTDIAFDGQNYLLVRNDSDGGIPGIYRYDPDSDEFALTCGTETSYADWQGLGVFDPDLAALRNSKVYVLLFGGQSNGEGWGYHRYLSEINHPLAVPRTDVDMFYEIAGTGTLAEDTILPLQSGTGKTVPKAGGYYPELTIDPVNRFGPELNFASTVRDLITIPDSKVAVIKFAFSGSSLYDSDDWFPDGTADRAADARLYRIFQQTAWKGIAALRNKYPLHKVEVLGMGWVQGESDAIEGQGAFYETNLTTFIQDVRLTFNTNLTFVLSKISMNQIDGTTDTNKLAQWPMVMAAQDAVAAADPYVAATSTTGTLYETALGYDEGQYHYTSAALLQIGEDLGVALVETSGLDSDQDSLPDEWENSYATPSAFMLDSDYDQDGFTDFQEYRIGTDPSDPADRLQLSLSGAATGRWKAAAGVQYRFQHSTNLTSWVDIGSAVLKSSDDPDATVDFSAYTGEPAGFFRILAE